MITSDLRQALSPQAPRARESLHVEEREIGNLWVNLSSALSPTVFNHFATGFSLRPSVRNARHGELKFVPPACSRVPGRPGATSRSQTVPICAQSAEFKGRPFAGDTWPNSYGVDEATSG